MKKNCFQVASTTIVAAVWARENCSFCPRLQFSRGKMKQTLVGTTTIVTEATFQGWRFQE